MISVCFQGKPFHIILIQVYVGKAESECFCEDLQDLLGQTPKKKCPLHHRGLECRSISQEIPGVTGKFGLEVQNEAGQRLTEFCQEKVVVIANTLIQQHNR